MSSWGMMTGCGPKACLLPSLAAFPYLQNLFSPPNFLMKAGLVFFFFLSDFKIKREDHCEESVLIKKGVSLLFGWGHMVCSKETFSA